MIFFFPQKIKSAEGWPSRRKDALGEGSGILPCLLVGFCPSQKQLVESSVSKGSQQAPPRETEGWSGGEGLRGLGQAGSLWVSAGLLAGPRSSTATCPPGGSLPEENWLKRRAQHKGAELPAGEAGHSFPGGHWAPVSPPGGYWGFSRKPPHDWSPCGLGLCLLSAPFAVVTSLLPPASRASTRPALQSGPFSLLRHFPR